MPQEQVREPRESNTPMNLSRLKLRTMRLTVLGGR